VLVGQADDGIASDAAAVLRRAGEQAVAAGRTFLDHDALERSCGVDGLDHDEVFAALQELADTGLVNMHFVEPSRITLLRLSDRGIRSYLTDVRPDLDDVRARMLAALRDETVPWQDGRAVDLAGALGEPPLVVEVLMEDLRRDGGVVFSKAFGGRLRVHRLG
jgi:hypothetical protein